MEDARSTVIKGAMFPQFRNGSSDQNSLVRWRLIIFRLFTRNVHLKNTLTLKSLVKPDHVAAP